MACGGQSYRQCWSDVVKAHGHKGLYNGFVSGLVCSSPDFTCLCYAVCSYSAACLPNCTRAHTGDIVCWGFQLVSNSLCKGKSGCT